jgi:hypothetical protein
MYFFIRERIQEIRHPDMVLLAYFTLKKTRLSEV